MTTRYAGQYFKQFQFFFGVVEDRNDPKELGRVRVRAFGIHSEDKSAIPTDQLPWAFPVMPFTSASISGVGTSPTGPVEGTWVFGFFADGTQMQMPMILGTMIGAPNTLPAFAPAGEFGDELSVLKGFFDPAGIYPKLYSAEPESGYLEESDVNRLARGDAIDKNEVIPIEGARPGEATIKVKTANRVTGVPKALPPKASSVKDGSPPGKHFPDYFGRQIWNEPNPRYGGQNVGEKAPYNLHAVRDEGATPTYGSTSKYPLNHVYVSETGHAFEVDDSPEAARIHQYHNSGTFYEIQPNGTRVTKIVGDDYEIVVHDKNMVVSGNVNITVNQSDLRLYVSKDQDKDKGGDIYFECDGDFNLNIKGDMVTKVQGSEHKEVLTDSATQINGKQSLRVTKDRITNIGGAHREDIGTVTVGSDHVQTITGSKSVTISNNSTQTVTNEIIIVAEKENASLSSGNNINIKAVSNTNMEMVKSLFVKTGEKVDIDANNNVEMNTPATVIIGGDTEVDIDGAKINLN
jgi:hypothetical protein